MKKLLLLVAITMASVGAYAQSESGTRFITPTIGLNLASTTGDGAKVKPGLAVGAVLTNRIGNLLGDHFGTSVGLLYSMEGAKTEGANLNLSYIQAPILLHYYAWKGLVIKAGIQYGFLLSAKAGSTNVYEDCNKTGLSIPVGASYEYDKFVVDARYNIGITKIAGEGSARNMAFQLTVGYRFDL